MEQHHDLSHDLLHILTDTFRDTLEVFPLLLLVYVLLELLEHRLDVSRYTRLLTGPAGPLIGAIAGCIPQCGFSAAAATLFNYKRVSGGALIAVFLATSDEAIPVLLAHPDQLPTVFKLLSCKIVIALFWGYCFWFITWMRYRRYHAVQPILMTEECRHEKTETFSFLHVLQHTLCITAYLFITMLVIHLVTDLLGQERIGTLLLADSIWQPVLAALVGLIPGCGTSILLTSLFLQGSLSFGAVTAGLCSSAGFGYLVLFQKRNIRTALAILCTFLAAAVSGMVLDLVL